MLFGDCREGPLLVMGKLLVVRTVAEIELMAAWLAMALAYERFKDQPLILEGGFLYTVNLVKEKSGDANEH